MKKMVSALVLAFALSIPAAAIVTVATSGISNAAESVDSAINAAKAKAAKAAHEESFSDIMAEHYQEGGWMMHFIAVAFAFGWAITIERIYYLYVKAKVNKHQFLSQIVADINAGNLDKAIEFAGKSNSPMAKIAKAGIERAKQGDVHFADAMDQASLANVPFLERNTPYLAMIGNVATLLGLLGTIVGLIAAFGAVAYADPSQKASILSKSIAEAMNCTAFGMVTAIPALIAFSILNGKTQRTIEDIQEASSVIVDKLNKRFQKA